MRSATSNALALIARVLYTIVLAPCDLRLSFSSPLACKCELCPSSELSLSRPELRQQMKSKTLAQAMLPMHPPGCTRSRSPISIGKPWMILYLGCDSFCPHIPTRLEKGSGMHRRHAHIKANLPVRDAPHSFGLVTRRMSRIIFRQTARGASIGWVKSFDRHAQDKSGRPPPAAARHVQAQPERGRVRAQVRPPATARAPPRPSRPSRAPWSRAIARRCPLTPAAAQLLRSGARQRLASDVAQQTRRGGRQSRGCSCTSDSDCDGAGHRSGRVRRGRPADLLRALS